MCNSIDSSVVKYSQAQSAKEIQKIARHLYEAKRRCGPKAKPSGQRHYRHVTFDFPSPIKGPTGNYGSVISFARQLYEKLGPIPLGLSLDRIDPHGPYSLDNLRYATPREQALNTRRADRFWR